MGQRRAKPNYTLRDSPFFQMHSRKELAKLLRVSVSALNEISRSEEADLYRRRWKPKRGDGRWLTQQPSPEVATNYRPIDIPDEGLKAIQSRLSDLLSRISPPEWLFSPVKGRSYVENAAYHRGARSFWMLDIADYFPNCSANGVAHFFRKKLGCSPDVTAILVRLTTLGGSLPQGSPCSPILAFFSNLTMWQEIEKIVSAARLKHSVYADDITISGPLIKKSTIWEIKKCVRKHGHFLKSEKETSRIDKPAQITGVVVYGNSLMLPFRQHKRLFELRAKRHAERDRLLLRTLDNQIGGRMAQKQQIESKNINPAT